MGDEQRCLLSVFFLSARGDPKARNTTCVTELELLFMTFMIGYEPIFAVDHNYDRFYPISEELVDSFQPKGYILTE